MGDLPWMTDNGTFIINGTERVVVSQLIRSPGVYFDADEDPATGRTLAQAKLIPDRGAWMEFETRKSDYLTIKFNRKRTIPVTILLRAMAAVDDGLQQSLDKSVDKGKKELPPILTTGTDEELMELFKEVDTNPDHRYIEATLRQEPDWPGKDNRTVAEEALLEFYKRMRPGDPPTLDNAREYLISQLSTSAAMTWSAWAAKLNQRLRLDVHIPRTHRTITRYDVVKLVETMIRINNGTDSADDIDHLGNRRVKTVGELIQNKLRVGAPHRTCCSRADVHPRERDLTPSR
jgi:DNA-directed RNA polymerase subunit beta